MTRLTRCGRSPSFPVIVVRSALFATGLPWQTSPNGLMRGPGKAPDERQKRSWKGRGTGVRRASSRQRPPLLPFHVPSHLPPSTHHHHFPSQPPTPSLWERVPWRPWDLCNIPCNAIPTRRLERCRSPSAVCHGWRRSQGSTSACRGKAAHEPGCEGQAVPFERR